MRRTRKIVLHIFKIVSCRVVARSVGSWFTSRVELGLSKGVGTTFLAPTEGVVVVAGPMRFQFVLRRGFGVIFWLRPWCACLLSLTSARGPGRRIMVNWIVVYSALSRLRASERGSRAPAPESMSFTLDRTEGAAVKHAALAVA